MKYINHMTIPDVIGEGGYGCVHKPSLKCKQQLNMTSKNKNKISKILFSTFAKKELKEYDKIGKIDKNENFYLGKPHDCAFDEKDAQNIKSLSKCDSGEEMITSQRDLTLLLMEDGGVNLELYANSFADNGSTKNHNDNIKKIELFWVESFRLLLGIEKLLQHGLIHNDLKPQNIIYSEDKKRINFIDFGLMSSLNEIIDVSIKNANPYTKSMYWAYPIETILFNHTSFVNFMQMTHEEREKFMMKISDDNALRTFFYYENTCMSDNDRMKMYLNDLYSFMMFNFKYPKINDYVLSKSEYEKEHHRHFLMNSLSTIDIYGLGISFNYMLSKTRHLLSDNINREFSRLFYLMITPNPFKRIKIDCLINAYETILKNNGLLEKYPHKISSSFLLSKEIENKMNKIIKNIATSIEVNEKSIINDARKTVLELKCKHGKVYNPLTKKCVEPCKKGHIRNKDFKCTSKIHVGGKIRKTKTARRFRVRNS
jgi:serine/threonine protein kinase